MKGWRWALALLAAALLLGASAWLPSALRQRRLEAALREAPHPPTSRRLAADAEVGLLQGNGNHCDYVAGELRAAPLSGPQLRAAYRASRVDLAILEAGASLPEARPLRRLAELGLRAPRTGETRYLVWLSEQSEAGFDPRCH